MKKAWFPIRLFVYLIRLSLLERADLSFLWFQIPADSEDVISPLQGYKIVVTNLHPNVTQDDIIVRYILRGLHTCSGDNSVKLVLPPSEVGSN